MKDEDGEDKYIDGRPIKLPIVSYRFLHYPIDASIDADGNYKIPEDAEMLELLDPYQLALNQIIPTEEVVDFASDDIYRFGRRDQDSELGNLVAEVMQKHPRMQADFVITNTLGIRADIRRGPITMEQLYNVIPFDNYLTSIYLSGREVQELLDFVTERSSGRGCSAQAQVAGIRFVMNCVKGEAEDIVIGGEPLNPNASYLVATNDYIAGGGSGFDVFRKNTTKFNTGISIRNALINHLQKQEKCSKGIFEDDDESSKYSHLPCIQHEEDGRIKRIFVNTVDGDENVANIEGAYDE